MKFKNTFVVLNAHTEEIKEILERLEASETIHTIDVDLMLEKLRTVYDVVSDLRNEMNKESEMSVDSVSEIVPEENDDKRTIDLAPEVEEAIDERPAERKVEEVQSAEKEEKTEPVSEESVKNDEDEVLSDKFKSEKPTLNEEIGSQANQDDLSSQLNTNPISNLTGAIGLNEKFELISELFDGDKNSFDKTMQVLNSSDSFVEAYSYLEEKFNWDMENHYVQRILELIRRKLIVRRNEQ